RLPRIIGRTRAIEFFATAGRYASRAALEMGLISRVSDPVLECARELAASYQVTKKEGGELRATFNPT
ncbi:MAG: hypothetical protein ABJA18_14210, partial [bacterium]